MFAGRKVKVNPGTVTGDVEDMVRGPIGGGVVHHGLTDDPVKVLLHGSWLGGGVHSSCLNRHLNG